MSIFDMKDGIDTNYDIYALLFENYDERKRAEEIQREMQQENSGKRNKNIFY